MWFHFDNFGEKSCLYTGMPSQEEADKKFARENPDWRDDPIYTYQGEDDDPNGKLIYDGDFPWDDYPEEEEEVEELKGEGESDETPEVGEEVTEEPTGCIDAIDEGNPEDKEKRE